ncbi:hypothetical protein CcI49_38510 [Frankia sp. CcI49]|nr:hypothetical protein CcI49_38510 [Frankia sp. CcI49]
MPRRDGAAAFLSEDPAGLHHDRSGGASSVAGPEFHPEPWWGSAGLNLISPSVIDVSTHPSGSVRSVVAIAAG